MFLKVWKQDCAWSTMQYGSGDVKYLEDMYSKCKDVDLVLYCMVMTECCFTPAEDRAMDLNTKRFGPKIWDQGENVFK